MGEKPVSEGAVNPGYFPCVVIKHTASKGRLKCFGLVWLEDCTSLPEGIQRKPEYFPKEKDCHPWASPLQLRESWGLCAIPALGRQAEKRNGIQKEVKKGEEQRSTESSLLRAYSTKLNNTLAQQ
ncbi:uncharacterized protein GJ701_007167 isoform 1-T5 [Geothlypis trichas]